MQLHRGDRYRLYPTLEQVARIEAWEGTLRWLWNQAHAERLAKLEAGYRTPSAFDQINDLTALRAALPWLRDVPRDVCAQALIELDKAWQRGFAKLTKMPRHKRKSHGDRAPLIAPQSFRVDGKDRKGFVVFPKLGAVPAVIHRAPRSAPKTCALVRDGDQWFACISCVIEVPEPKTNNKPAVGIDRGVVLLLADSDGRVVEAPRTFKKNRKKLKTAQRRAARKQRGSKNKRRAKGCVAAVHRKSRRQREAVLHREAKHYAKNHGTVIVERLNIRGMTASAKGTLDEPGTNVAQKSGLNRAILDGGWGRFLEMVRYKSEPFGTRVIEVVAAYSSQECAACEHVAAQSRRSQSEFECVACGHRANADINAAQVILRRGTHGAEGFGGDAVARPVKKQLRAARRATRRVDRSFQKLRHSCRVRLTRGDARRSLGKHVARWAWRHADSRTSWAASPPDRSRRSRWSRRSAFGARSVARDTLPLP